MDDIGSLLTERSESIIYGYNDYVVKSSEHVSGKLIARTVDKFAPVYVDHYWIRFSDSRLSLNMLID